MTWNIYKNANNSDLNVQCITLYVGFTFCIYMKNINQGLCWWSWFRVCHRDRDDDFHSWPPTRTRADGPKAQAVTLTVGASKIKSKSRTVTVASSWAFRASNSQASHMPPGLRVIARSQNHGRVSLRSRLRITGTVLRQCGGDFDERKKRDQSKHKLRILSNEKFECFHRLTLTLPALLSEVEAG